MLKRFPLTLLFILLSANGASERAPLALSSPAYLFENSDAILVLNRGNYGDRCQVESVLVSNGGLDVKKGDEVYVDLNRDYRHDQPLLYRGERYLLFLDILEVISPGESEIFVVDGEKVLGSSIKRKFNRYSVVGGAHGVVPLFDLRELANHPRIVRMKNVAPNFDPIGAQMTRLRTNFNTDNGVEVLIGVETIIKLYSETTSEKRVDLMIDGLTSENKATIKLISELMKEAVLVDLDLFSGA